MQQAIYESEVDRLGLDRSGINQFFSFIWNCISGDWGQSLTVSSGAQVSELVAQRFPRTLEVSLLALAFAVPFGTLVGILLGKFPNSIGDYVVRILCFLALGMVVFWTGLQAQYNISYRLDLLPATLYNTPYIEVEQVTGLRLLDCLLAGNMEAWWDTVRHLILPVAQLVPHIAAITILQTRSIWVKRTKLKHPKINPDVNEDPKVWPIALYLGILSLLLLSVETAFGLPGFMTLFAKSIRSYDYNLIMFSLYRYLVIFIWVNFLVNFFHGLTQPPISERIVGDNPSFETFEPSLEPLPNDELSLETPKRLGIPLKEWINPIPLLIGGGILLLLVLTALLVPLFFDKALLQIDTSSPAYAPPSPDHLLGTTKFGRDVFGRLLWGIRGSILIGLTTLLLGGIFGIPIGLIAGFYGHEVDRIIMAITNVLLYLPLLWFPLILSMSVDQTLPNMIWILGVLSIPYMAWITRNLTASTKAELIHTKKNSPTIKKPIQSRALIGPVLIKLAGKLSFLFVATIILYETINYLGFGDPANISWGRDINLAREKIVKAPWTALWPGRGIFLLCFSVFIIGLGFREEKRK